MTRILARGNQKPILPGMEEYSTPIPSTPPKQKRCRRDLYNLRLLKGLRAVSENGFPELLPWTPTKVSQPMAFHEARAYYRKYGTLKGYFVHFFIDDEKFDCVRKCPERYIKMFRAADFIIAPDFSTYCNYPFPVLLKNAFDNMVLAAFFQKEECNVVANIIWAFPLLYDVLFSGQPVGGMICVSSKAIDLRDKKGIQRWLHGYAEAIARFRPCMVLRIGKRIPGEDAIFLNPIRREEVNPYIQRMRHGG